VIGALAAALVVSVLPEGAVRYRVEIGGARVGAAELAVRCAGDRCAVSWESRLRLPAEAGGGTRAHRIESPVDRSGRLLGPVAIEADGARRTVPAVAGAVPTSAAEIALMDLPEGVGCLPVLDEESGWAGRACARREGARLELDVNGVREVVAPGADGFPAAVEIPAQRARFVRDPLARVPAAPPRLAVRVSGPDDPRRARRFCGLPADAAPRPVDLAGLPPPRAPGASCREKAAAYGAALARGGRAARTAVGVAHDGGGFVWHAWTEVATAEGWIPVDPSFGEAPTRGPRFTVARFAEEDRAARAEAGRRILACWGRAAVEE
jgi:hypothetical protein